MTSSVTKLLPKINAFTFNMTYIMLIRIMSIKNKLKNIQIMQRKQNIYNTKKKKTSSYKRNIYFAHQIFHLSFELHYWKNIYS